MRSYISIIGEHFLECLVSDRNYAHSHLITVFVYCTGRGHRGACSLYPCLCYVNKISYLLRESDCCIQAEKIEHDKVSKLLEFLSRQDDKLLLKFYEILTSDQQRHVVEILKRNGTTVSLLYYLVQNLLTSRLSILPYVLTAYAHKTTFKTTCKRSCALQYFILKARTSAPNECNNTT